MRLILLIITFISIKLVSFSQDYNQHIDTLITKVNIDTLRKYVNDLSGETSVIVNGDTLYITHRIDDLDNDLAADYIKQTLQKTGLIIDDLTYSTTGRNIIAYQIGNEFPDEHYIICAHYDAIPYHGADDNASGTAAVMETARILSQYEFPYTIVYALWDQEEIGLIGSRYWAHEAFTSNINIKGVLNLDMIGYNTTENNRFDIHVQAYENSVELGNYVYNLSSVFDLSLNPMIYNPGSASSDHRSFWENGFSAVFIVEPSTWTMLNPHYHTNEDRIDKFNMDFFHEMSKLSLGVISSLALGEQYTAVDNTKNEELFQVSIQPNPVFSYGFVKVSMFFDSQLKIDIISATGNILQTLADQRFSPGNYKFYLTNLNLDPGIYYVRVQTKVGVKTLKLILLL